MKKLALSLVNQLGWKINNMLPETVCKKAVVVLAPHTSNWDFFYGMLFKFSHPTLRIKFAIKKEVMFFPLSCIMKALGAIPIDRQLQPTHKRSNMVSVMAELFHNTDNLLLMIAPEGTRSYVKRWKTGFYRLATMANVPIILGYINYAQKEMGLGALFHPTGNMEEDIAAIQNFYRTIPGKYPTQGVI